MDAIGAQTMYTGAYGQAVWFWLPDAGVNPRVKSPGGWGLKSPAHQEERGAAVKPLRRECRMFRLTCIDLWASFFSAHKACGCGQRPAFPAPSSFKRDTDHASPGREIAPRECEAVSSSSLRGARK